MKNEDWNVGAQPTFWINHASRLIVREFERVLRPYHLGFAYFPVLAALRQEGKLRQSDLARRMGVEQPSMATLLSRMERDGIIARTPDPDDKRASHIDFTRQAKARMPAAEAGLRDVVERALTGLSASERKTLITLLRRVVHNLTSEEDRARGPLTRHR